MFYPLLLSEQGRRRVLPFSPLFKEQHFEIPIRPGMADKAEPPCGFATLFSLFKRNFHVPTPLRFHRLYAGASDNDVGF